MTRSQVILQLFRESINNYNNFILTTIILILPADIR